MRKYLNFPSYCLISRVPYYTNLAFILQFIQIVIELMHGAVPKCVKPQTSLSKFLPLEERKFLSFQEKLQVNIR